MILSIFCCCESLIIQEHTQKKEPLYVNNVKMNTCENLGKILIRPLTKTLEKSTISPRVKIKSKNRKLKEQFFN